MSQSRILKGGLYVNGVRRRRDGTVQNYLRVSAGPQRGRYVHQLVAEAMLGRSLMHCETVDHVDGDTLNNTWLNLQVVPRSKNTSLMRARVSKGKG